MHDASPRKEDEEEKQCFVHTNDSCLELFFAEYLFILENEIKAFFNLIFLNFNIRRTSMHSTSFCVCVCVFVIIILNWNNK